MVASVTVSPNVRREAPLESDDGCTTIDSHAVPNTRQFHVRKLLLVGARSSTPASPDGPMDRPMVQPMGRFDWICRFDSIQSTSNSFRFKMYWIRPIRSEFLNFFDSIRAWNRYVTIMAQECLRTTFGWPAWGGQKELPEASNANEIGSYHAIYN